MKAATVLKKAKANRSKRVKEEIAKIKKHIDHSADGGFMDTTYPKPILHENVEKLRSDGFRLFLIHDDGNKARTRIEWGDEVA